jgi:hypothetical protein
MSTYDYITIDGSQIRRPDEFAPQREDIYAGEYTTCTGATRADVVGWKYADMTLKWQALTEAEVNVLIGMSGATTLVFDDPSSNTISEQVIRKSAVAMRHRYHELGETWWTEVECEISFIDAHGSSS